jgi:hypothetical protein
MTSPGIFKDAVQRLETAFLLALFLPFSAHATLVLEGSIEEKAELRKIIDAYKKDSPKAQAIVADLEKTETGDVKVRFGKTADIATAQPGAKIITINKPAVSAMKLIEKPDGGGKALEQFSMPYLFGHEGIHILRPGDTEDQVVSRNNEVRVEKGSSKRTKYEVDKVGEKTVLPFDDGSKVDLTDAFRASAATGGSPGVSILQTAGNLAFSALEDATTGELTLGLTQGSIDQYMTLSLPDELGGELISVKLLEISTRLTPSSSMDFSLVANDFYMKFEAFDLGGRNTGTNIIRPYLPHQTPYGYREILADDVLRFDFSGDLGWTNALFDEESFALAVESFDITLARTAGNGWAGTGSLSGMKFTVPEPSSALLIFAGAFALVALRSRSAPIQTPAA